jgi:cystathionine beta-lyase
MSRDHRLDRPVDASRVTAGWNTLATRMVRAGRNAGGDGPDDGFVNPPVERGSTVLFPSLQALRERGSKRYGHELTYGACGTPTQFHLEAVIAEIEGGTHSQIVSSGLAAVTTPLLAFLGAGGHCLMPDCVYGPTRRFCDTMLRRMGIETSFYEPMISAAGLQALMRPNTQVVFAESPGSHSFEVQDVPMLAQVAHAHGAKLLLDNTWGIHVFQPFAHGADVSIQALTKYAGGHADVIAGAVTVADDQDWHVLRDAAIQLGQYASPDDCWLTLRGLRTLGIRLERQSRSALAVAQWFAGRDEVAQVLHPALPGSPGHEIWLRDFAGASSLFGVVFRPDFELGAVDAMVDALGVFGIGESWGGYESLALPSTPTIMRSLSSSRFEGPACRFHIGLEDPDELIADLEGGLAVLRAASE